MNNRKGKVKNEEKKGLTAVQKALLKTGSGRAFSRKPEVSTRAAEAPQDLRDEQLLIFFLILDMQSSTRTLESDLSLKTWLPHPMVAGLVPPTFVPLDFQDKDAKRSVRDILICHLSKYQPLRFLITAMARTNLMDIIRLFGQLDVTTAFLNEEFEEEIYMEQPEGFVASGQENNVCKVVKFLYGLKQALKQCYRKFDQAKVISGFIINECDKCVNVKKTTHD
ncbi:hypothetical protein LXL04_016906 [Taraxacum kok-saghyz]